MYRAFITMLVLVLFCASAASASANMLNVPLSFDDVVSRSSLNGCNGSVRLGNRIDLPGFSSYVSSGDPALPCKLIYVALPPNADISTVSVDSSSYSTQLLKGSYRISPVPPAATADGSRYWGNNKDIAGGYNRLVYESDTFYPAEHVRLLSVDHLRTWKVAVLEFWPYCYNPVTKKLRAFDSQGVSVSYSTEFIDAAAADPVAGGMAGFIENRHTAFSWYSTRAAVPDAAMTATDYVIITTSSVASASTMLDYFIDFQATRSHNVIVVTEDEWGGGTGNTAAENIRRWLQNHYLGMGIKYVLLIGNPNPYTGSVPMKMLWPRNNQSSYKEAPSDYYYADLTGNWDRDGDGYYGEEPDDFGYGGVDRIPEVYVGRIPFYGDVKELDSILNKMIGYGSLNLGEWSRRVLLPMKPLDSLTPCYQLGESIRRDIVEPAGFSGLRFYDSQYNLNPLPEYVPCTYESVVNQWKQGAGMVVWLSHGGSTYAQEVISANRCSYLDDSRPAVVYAGSCNNGQPEDMNNLSYRLLCQGAISTLSASRVSWYYIGENMYTYSDSVGGLGYQYAHYILQQRETFGQASMHARLNVPKNIWPNQLVMNLYGDPSLAFDQVNPGRISGKVLSTTGEPAPGAVVRVTETGMTVVSGEDGSYALSGLSPGEYGITVACAGYYDQAFADIPVFAGKLTPLDFHLVATGVGGITGYVIDCYHSPIPDALVTLDNGLSVYTAQDGSFEFARVNPGAHIVSASKAPYASRTLVDCLVPEKKPVQVSIVLQSYRADVILNSNFEEGFDESGIARGWNFYSSYGYNATPMAGSEMVKWGLSSQKLHMPEPSSGEAHAGFYQTVSVTPGTKYTLVAWKKSHYSGEEANSCDNIVCRIGYDPAGGTAYYSPAIVWRQFNCTHNLWQIEFTDFIPYHNSITVFIEAVRKHSGGGDDCYAWFDGIFLIGLAQAPSVPVVHIDDRYQNNLNSISASWTCSDTDVKEYEWAISTSADESGIIPGGGWTRVGLSTSATRLGLNLRPGDAVRALVRARNKLNVTGEIGVSEPVRVINKLSSIKDYKNVREGSWISLEGLFVTRMGDGPECFLEDSARTIGVKAIGTWSSVPYLLPGTRTTVTGCVTTLDGMRVLTGAELVPSTVGAVPGAYAMMNRSVGLPINMGLLITAWGRVIANTQDGFLLNDGSAADGLPVICFNSTPCPALGDYIRVTGISTPYGLAVYSSNDIGPLQ